MKLPAPADARGAEAPRDDLERAVGSVFAQLLSSRSRAGKTIFSCWAEIRCRSSSCKRVCATSSALRLRFNDDTTVAGIAPGIRANLIRHAFRREAASRS